MPGPMRAPTGLTARNHAARPPQTRPTYVRTASLAPSLPGRIPSGIMSPTNSIASVPTSHSRSPLRQNGMKRKERDFEAEGGEETNIHVVVRCRGRNDREVRENSGVVLATEGTKGKTVVLSMGASALSNKTYNFDRVFSPAADQAMIYDDVVTPILDEMLQGFNCTIFAYGQTGTGKTYTMSGDMSDTLGLLSDSAGIIPRALNSLFRKLEADESESSVKCSFIELYNEELRDLLSVDDNVKLKIFDDVQRKGHSATIVQGMEESHIKNADEGIKLLQDGSSRRQVAATKCNDLSSRSHTVFTVTAYMKRRTGTGEDFVSIGKLNLVDLAGSENIQRSGAENKRATEAGLINKSLLTLGRVINALVDRGSHIPYRESKLTRLLQDSLGGRTKTCIIATVSPAKSNLEETISTLDYAFRAKNIRNKPQVNPMVSKKTLLREFTSEIEKLKSELIATRQRNGVYLTAETYEEITVESESRKILSEEQKAKIETMEANLRNKIQELFTLTSSFAILKKDNETTKQALDDTSEVLQKTEIVLANTRQNLADETLLRKAHQATEEELSAQGGELISTLDQTVKDVNGLRAKIRRKSDTQSINRFKWQSSQNQVSEVTELVESRINEFQGAQQHALEELSGRLEGYVAHELQHLLGRHSSVTDTSEALDRLGTEVTEQASHARNEMNNVLEEIKVLREDVKQKVGQGLQGLSAAAGRISAGVIQELEGFHSQLHASYNSLGRDFKNIFDDLTKHLNTQKAEAEELRRQLATATAEAARSNEELSQRLETHLAEERDQAAADHKHLLAQITSLMNTGASAQEDRWTCKINKVQAEMATARAELQDADKKYSASMDSWSQKENCLIEEVLRSRESLKTKLKTDWTAVNEHNTSIQATTKSVHEETIRIVDTQMKDMAIQMAALDDFVTRARCHNESHHDSHVNSLQRLTTTVSACLNTTAVDLTDSSSRVQSVATDLGARTSSIISALPSLDTTIRNPLSKLRETVLAAPITEYRSTGETPQKRQYSYPTTLPCTKPHAQLLSANSPPSLEDLLDGPPSPTKSTVYADSFDDINDTGAITRPSTADGLGLKEIDVNVGANMGLGGPRNSEPLLGFESTKSESRILESARGAMGPPPLKRLATVDSRLPMKGQKGRAEGRENLPVGTVGGRRRLRSSVRGS